MRKKRRDFLSISLFGFAISTAILIAIQIICNILYFWFQVDIPSFEYNLKIFIIFEIILLILSAILGRIYTNKFYEYKIDDNGRERKTRRH
jgi:hypothetical protein